MSSPLLVTRASRTAVYCGMAGYVSTWLVHLVMAQFWRVASSYEIWDGTMISLYGGVLAAFLGLYLSQVIRKLVWLIVLCGLMLIGVPILNAIAGFFGLLTVEHLLHLFGWYNNNDLVRLGYYIMPPIWATVIGFGLCWHYKATHGGLSLLNFDPPEPCGDDS